MVWFFLESSQFPHPLPLPDLVAIVLQMVIDGAGITGNSALLVTIFYKSPKMFSSYKILLANGAFIDLLASTTCLMGLERMIPAPFGTAIVYLGPCSLISPKVCHTIHALAMNSQTHSIYLVAASFFYRLYILEHSTPSRMQMMIIALLLSLLPLFMIICTLHSIDDDAEVREAFREIYDDLDDYFVQGHLKSHPKILFKFSQLYTAGSALPVTATVFFVRRKVNQAIEEQKKGMSERTSNMHKTLVKVLTLQACLPVIFTITIGCYVLEKGGFYHHPIIEHLIRVTISLIASIAPYTTILNIRVFRDFVLCRKSVYGRSATSIVHSLSKPNSNL